MHGAGLHSYNAFVPPRSLLPGPIPFVDDLSFRSRAGVDYYDAMIEAITPIAGDEDWGPRGREGGRET